MVEIELRVLATGELSSVVEPLPCGEEVELCVLVTVRVPVLRRLSWVC